MKRAKPSIQLLTKSDTKHLYKLSDGIWAIGLTRFYQTRLGLK